jgi:hypothetical protein
MEAVEWEEVVELWELWDLMGEGVLMVQQMRTEMAEHVEWTREFPVH